ncbi:transmembrane protein, putative (macronuclear) [Tetrahymena thermophila SB210]|uniref:Transmembrane protein, putative n=1 Tax=Tetrahymena thermophila (strain SB210) TaxID=312017 RepID=Q22TF2_TETTS|nr:transmembrane protein, putative [Tetrahymena thermophila SB210]EAR88486.2 transmembrane protein, putative [Tetrahymena thermophila SB210]|eukprot:XP_001008731.2 transmembrane protein, putative [Tetrahymena thermophila SB210]
MFLGSLIISLDYSYSFYDEDILDKCDSHLNPTLFHLDLILCISSCFFDIYEVIGVSFTISLIKAIIVLRNHTYLNKDALRWCLIFFAIRINIVFCYLIYVINESNQDILFFAIIVLIPLSYKIGNEVFQNYYEYINQQITSQNAQNGQQQEISLFKFILNDPNKKVDIFCRLLFEGIKERIHFPSQIENSTFIFAKQIIELEKQADSQGTQEQDDYDNKLNNKRGINKILDKQKLKFSEKEILNDSFNVQAMKNILSLYEEHLKQKKITNCLNELHFSYLTFLATLSMNSCLSYIQILNVKSNQKLRMGLKDQQKMQLIMKQAEIQSQINQSRMKKEEEFQLYLILEFEDEMNKLQQQYFQCLRQYKAAVEKLSMSFVEINEILLILKEYRDGRNKLEASIIHQLQMNSQSQSLKNLCMNFDFYMLHKSSLLQFYENQNRQQIQQLKRKDYYSKHSCFIYVSLLDRSLGAIQKANRAFVKAFGFQNKQQILGKLVQSILPDAFLKRSSEAALSQIITEEFLSLYNQTLDMPLFVAKNSLGYSIPLQLKIQSQMIDSNDFGITIWAKPIKDDNMYIMLDYKDHSQIKVASRHFYQEFIYENFNLQQAKSIRMESLIPILNDLIKISQVEKGRKFETLLIQPQDKMEAKRRPDLKDPNFLNYLKFAQVYVISVQFQIFSSKLSSFVNMIIENYEPLNYMRDKVQYIQMYQSQIKELSGISLHFDPDYEQDDVLSDTRVKQFKVKEYFSGTEKKTETQFSNTQNESTSAIQNLQNSTNLNQQNILKNIQNEVDKQLSLQMQEENLKNCEKQFPSPPKKEMQQSYQVKEDSSYIINLYSFNNLEKRHDDIHQGSNFNITEQTIQGVQIANQLNARVQKESNENSPSEIQNVQSEGLQNNQENEEDNKIKKMFQGCESKDFNQNSAFHDILNSKEINLELNSKDSTQNIYYELEKKQRQLQNLNTKDSSFNQLLLSTKTGFQFTAFQSKRLKPANNENDKLDKEKEKQKDYSVDKESKFPITHDESQKKQNKDMQSVSSSNKSVQTQYLFQMIHTKKQMNYLKIINGIGIISVLATLSLTFSGFFTFYTNLIQQRENFKYINWIYIINIEMSYALSETYIKMLNNQGFLETPASQNQAFNQQLQTQIQSRIKLSKDNMVTLYNNTNMDIEVFKIVKQQQILQKIYNGKSSYDEYNLSLLYSMLLQVAGIYYFATDQDPSGIFLQQNEQNYPNLNSQVQSVITQLSSQYQTQFASILNQSLIQLYVVILVTFFFLSSIVPSYTFAKLRQQKILELFATFDPKSLKEILSQLTIQLSYYNGFEKNQTMGSRSNYSTNLNQTHLSKQMQTQINIEKKLNISRTSPLQYSLKYLIIGLITIFCLILIYPIINYVIVRQFIDNSTVINDFNNVVCQSYFTIVNSLRARQGLAMAYLIPSSHSMPISTYQGLFDDITQQINQLPNLINESIGKVQSTKMYNYQIFQDYLINVYTGNACNTMQNYTQYQNGDFLYNQCISVGKGSLQQGLLNGIIYYINVYKDYLSFVYSYNSDMFQQSFNNYNSNVPTYKQFQLKIELSKAHEYILNFFQDQNIQLYNYYEQISIILFLFQVSFVSLIFSISWFYYIKSVNSLIFSTKEFLDIFPQQTLLQNTYIMSFLRKNE